MPKKLKIYLDTSVISYLEQEDSPERMAETRQLWHQLQERAAYYDIYLSDVTLQELSEAPEPKRSSLIAHLVEIEYTKVPLTEETDALADKVISLGILKPKSRDDADHIAAAVIAGCDFIVSWNFKHLVNVRTINGVRGVALASGYRDIGIVSPPSMLENDE